MATPKEHLELVSKYYTLTLPFYFLWHKSSLGLHHGFWGDSVSNRAEAIIKENEILADRVGINVGDSVLDAGCGIGGSSLWLAEKRGSHVLGLNITHRQLREATKFAAKKGLSGRVCFVDGDYQQLPIQDGSVNVYWAIESIEHAALPEQVICEAFRVLKPRGRIVIAGMFKGRESLTDRQQRQFQLGMSVAGCFEEKGFKTSEQMAQILQDSGFVDVENKNERDLIIKSSEQMARMCRLGLPLARLLADLHLVNPILIGNNKWGIYQNELYDSGGMTYNVLTGSKP